MLLGIALIVQEVNKGPRLVFRYPEKRSIYYNNMFEELNSLEKEQKSDKYDYVHAESSLSAKYKEAFEQYFSYSNENLARLFRIKIAMVGKPLEFSIEKLKFYSFPYNSPTTYENPEVENLKKGIKEIISSFCIVFITIPGELLSALDPTFRYNCSAHHFLSSGQDPMSLFMGLKYFHGAICSMTYSKLLEEATRSLYTEEIKSLYLSLQVNLIMNSLDSHTVKEKFKSYLSGLKQASWISESLDVKSGNRMLENEIDNDTIDMSESAELYNSFESYNYHKVFSISTLANEFRQLFHDISGGCPSVNIRFNNNQLPVNVILHCLDPTKCHDCTLGLLSHPPLLLSTTSSTTPIQTKDSLIIHGINLNVQTVLLMESPEIIRSKLLIGEKHSDNFANSRLSAFIEFNDPTKSLIDLSYILDEPIEELISISNYLQNRGLVEIINVICDDTIYKIHPEAPLHPNSEVSRAFDTLIESFDNKCNYKLQRFLSLFNGKNRVNEIITFLPQILVDYGMEMILFLLRWRMIITIEPVIVSLHQSRLFHEKSLAQNQSSVAKCSSDLFSIGYNLLEGDSESTSNQDDARINLAKLFGIPFESLKEFDQEELAILQKLHPYLFQDVLALKSLYELSWSCKIEIDKILDVLKKASFLSLTFTAAV